MNPGEIKSIDELRHWMVDAKGKPCLVSTAIRREWMLKHSVVVISGTVYRIQFENLGGGVWEASCD